MHARSTTVSSRRILSCALVLSDGSVVIECTNVCIVHTECLYVRAFISVLKDLFVFLHSGNKHHLEQKRNNKIQQKGISYAQKKTCFRCSTTVVEATKSSV